MAPIVTSIVDYDKSYYNFVIFNYNFGCDVYEDQILQVMNIISNVNMFGSRYWDELLKQCVISVSRFPMDLVAFIDSNISSWDRELRLSSLLNKDVVEEKCEYSPDLNLSDTDDE